jgi:hypothetical protein
LLGEDIFDDTAGFHTSEFKVEALGFIGKSIVLQPEQVEHGGMELVDGDGVFGDAIAEFIGFAVGGSSFDAAAGEEDGECLDVVVSACAVATALSHGSSAEFATPDDKCFIEHAALFKIGD